MRLLVSIADPAEVGEALEGGADIVDAKDPAAGPMGAPSPPVARALRERVRAPRLTSVALGDVSDDPRSLPAIARGAAALGIDFVKVGLGAGLRPSADALGKIVEAVEATNPGTRVVAVAYADLDGSGPVGPGELAALARDAGAAGIMLDTARKDGRSLLDALDEVGLRRFVRSARRNGLWAALAGNLGPAHVDALRPLGPDVIGVRGAACRGGRVGRVDAVLVRELAQRIRCHSPPRGVTTSQTIPGGRALSK